jgi:hypothetical protein
MLYLNDERADLNVLENYKGSDYVLKLLASTYQQAKEMGFPLKFKCDALQKAYKEGKKGIYIPFSGDIQTPTGSVKIDYCQSARSVAGGVGINYKPRGESMTKTWKLDKGDLDKILFLMVGCPLVKNGTIYIEDLEKRAAEVASRRTAGSALSFYLYNEHSPLYSDENKLMTIAMALGIPNVKPETYGLNELKNMIFEKVEAAEKIHDATFGYKWFGDAVNEFTPLMTALKDVQTAIDSNIIRFNDKLFKWMLLDGKGNDLRILCPIEPAKTSLRREILADYCLKDKEAYGLIRTNIDSVKKEEYSIGDVSLSREATGDEIEKADFATMEWMKLRSLAAKNSILIKGRNKAEIIKELESRRDALI